MRARAFLSTPAVLVAARAAGLSGKAQRRAVVDTPHRCELARAKQPNHAQRVSLGWTHELVVLVRHGGGCRGCSLHRREPQRKQTYPATHANVVCAMVNGAIYPPSKTAS